MNLEELFKLQLELDKKIVEQHALQNRSLVSEKILALQVEIGELANETRCFKYWSTKKPSSKEIILEEYVDCFHFLLSIGLEFKFTDIQVQGVNLDNKLTEQFLNIYIDVNDFTICSSRDHYITLFEDFLSLGESLDFTEEDILRHYHKKNDINHKRQASGY